MTVFIWFLIYLLLVIAVLFAGFVLGVIAMTRIIGKDLKELSNEIQTQKEVK